MAKTILALFSFVILLAYVPFSSQYDVLTPSFYNTTCVNLYAIVSEVMEAEIGIEARMGASILRLHFHDCFVQGCDASILLKDSTNLLGEHTAPQNLHSVRGFHVIEKIKSRLEAACPNTVSCSDILALAARDSVTLLGGPFWDVPLGRRDTRNSNKNETTDLPGPMSSIGNLTASFAAKGLSARDLVALSGAHTIGSARCKFFTNRPGDDTNIDPSFLANMNSLCHQNDNRLVHLDVQSPFVFDNAFYQNLISFQGLLHSDAELLKGQESIVQLYARDIAAFFDDFKTAMIKMSLISPLTGEEGEIRTVCGNPN